MFRRSLSLLITLCLVASPLQLISRATAAGPSVQSPSPASPRLGAADRPTKLAKGSDPTPEAGRVLLRLKRGVSAARAKKAGRLLGYRVVETLPELGWVVAVPTSSDSSVNDLQKRARAAGIAEKVATEKPIQPAYAPSDPLFVEQWGFSNTGQYGGKIGADARAVSAWDWARGTGTVVAVTDTGVDLGHPDLAGQAWVNPDEVPGNGIDDDGNGRVDDINGWDFYNSDASVFDAGDGDKHGTHVAGTVAAATGNGIGGAGTAPEARIMALKFLGPAGGTDAAAAAAITYAVDEGATVINASWGSTESSSILADAVAYAARRGVLLVCAAGNAGANTDVTPFYPASYPTTNVVSVAALNRFDGLAGFSNRGATSVDLGAPGADIASTQPVLGSSLFVDKAPYKVVYHGFPVEYVTNSGARQQIVSRSLTLLGATQSTPILVVDDSWPTIANENPDARLGAYTSALAASGFTNVTTWRRDVLGVPSASAMAGKTVVWFTGASSYGLSAYQSYGTLSSTERSNLTTFLTGGGRLMMSSGDLGYDMTMYGGSALTWYSTYMNATYADDDPWTGRFKWPESTLGPEFSADVADPIRYSDGCDDIEPLNGYATRLSQWAGYVAISGTSMAAPHVSGALALAASRQPSATAAELKARLLGSVRPVSALSGTTATGGALDAAALVGRLSAPSNFSASPRVGSVALAWSNPAEHDFARVRVLARTDASPTGPNDPSAILVYEGNGASATHSGLQPGVPVYYGVFATNTLGSWSQAALASATPLAPPPPAVVGDSYTTRSGRTLSVAAPGVRANDINVSGTISVSSAPARGSVLLRQDGSFQYTPESGFFGSDSFSYTLSDGGVTHTATVSIEVLRYRLDTLSTNAATPGTAVTFSGTGFGDEQNGGYVSFAGTRAKVTSWSDTKVVAEVPSGASAGYCGIVVEGQATNGKWFAPSPRLDSLSSGRGVPGTLITFNGAGFGAIQGSGFVSFSGVRAVVLTWSDTQVVAIVPEGATSGYAGVLQNGAMSNGKWFVPFTAPTVTAMSANHGAPGTAVTFTGSGFGATQGDGYASFAGAKGTIVSWSDTEVVAVVPEGAVAGYAGIYRNGAMSNGRWFVPSAGPRVTALSSPSLAPGQTLTISGTGFGSTQGAGWVTFGGVPATVVSWSDTSVTAIVPLGITACYVGVVQGGVVSNGLYFVAAP